ncbi:MULTISPECIES: RcnB family protein [Tatumella]|uniref:RcnB family protein n=1 Tax=Tatumella punctata TaxID=399969 RepID=A0ABW1VPW3_9GAMM|nr:MULTISPECIES: RcnB family protein [unclassified Tatumella]MBS0856999.1 RcnB family protein [Tatumella sp. JGM16]MBS0878351.1 RcnB family protein [Tatumella sp. JGM82]MBS0891840.1 RcnB family protein [Tatumella sp. JGM94]MBS0894605.1 RcnB family protein [Tatumella sp. JGM130]MBS0903027.1 RcnB family protein [Tatumella sp. JGM100]
MKRITIALLTTVLLTDGVMISSAMAAPGDQQGGQFVPRQQENGPQHQGNMSQQRPDNRQQQGNGPGQRPDNGQYRSQQAGEHGGGSPRHRQAERFAFHGNDFRRGHEMPQNYRGPQYRVNDWRARGLNQPPQGHYWANINGNYVLMAAATGIITSIILNGALSH